MPTRLAALASLIAVSLLAATAHAQAPEARGSYNDWRVFTQGADAGLICFAITSPRESAPSSVNHGDVFFMISTWRSGDAVEQPRFIAGYALRPENPPRVRVGSDRFAMFASGNDGFIEELRDESRLVGAMRRGASMRVEASSQRGTATTYEFSLSGVSAALDRVRALCGR